MRVEPAPQPASHRGHAIVMFEAFEAHICFVPKDVDVDKSDCGAAALDEYPTSPVASVVMNGTA